MSPELIPAFCIGQTSLPKTSRPPCSPRKIGRTPIISGTKIMQRETGSSIMMTSVKFTEASISLFRHDSCTPPWNFFWRNLRMCRYSPNIRIGFILTGITALEIRRRFGDYFHLPRDTIRTIYRYPRPSRWRVLTNLNPSPPTRAFFTISKEN